MKIIENEKAKFKTALRKYLNTHCSYCSTVVLYIKLFLCEVIYNSVYKIFAVLYTVKIVYICVFMTCSTSYCLVTHLWIHGMYVCVCVCVCVCVYVCMYVCMYVHLVNIGVHYMHVIIECPITEK